MLSEITITGLGAISHATAQFDAGLTCVTGETGAGKTMVVTGLHLLGGARADAGRVRQGSERAVVEGRFRTDTVHAEAQLAVAAVLESSGAHRDEDGSVIAVRSVGSDGRSRAHLGGRSVPAAALSDFTAPLLTVHGQHDQLRLRRGDQQLRALDQFAGEPVAAAVQHYQQVREQWLTLRAELLERTSRRRERALEAQQLQHALTEIDGVAPELGEDHRIVTQVRRLSELDSVREAAAGAHDALAGPDESHDTVTSALDLLGRARSQLAGTDDPALVATADRLAEAVSIAADVTTDLASYLADLPSDPAALDSLLTRQAELKALTRTYAADIDGVLAWADQARARLASLDVSDEAVATLTKHVDAAAGEVATAARTLTAARVSAAGQLAEAVGAELTGLAMGRATLEVAVRPLVASARDTAPITIDGEQLHAATTGVEEVEFRLASHPGSASLPLGKSASGGELSRVMLALEVVLAGGEPGTTLVFDEVDAGVGGRAAVEIGRRLARLARTHQVIVVTHLPQVAAFADSHVVVDKMDSHPKESADSAVRSLGIDERVGELARMLAGLGDTETGRAHAEELLKTARGVKSGVSVR